VLTGSGNTPPPTVPARAKHMPRDLARWARRYGVELAWNPAFAMSTVQALRSALAAQDGGSFAALHRALFRAVWVDRKNVSDPAVIADVVAKAGVDSAARLKAKVDEALARGAFGLPSFFVGDELFFGNDWLQFVEEALSRS